MAKEKLIRELGWLSGIIDGEGSIGLTRFFDRRPNRNVAYRPTIQVTNCNEDIILEVERIYKLLNIGYVKWKGVSKNPKHKDAYSLAVGKLSEVSKLCDILTGLLIGKRPQLEIVKSFCKRKMNMVRRSTNGRFIEVIDIVAEDYVDKIKKLNSKGKWKK